MESQRQLKRHRRGPWACDECRLRKKKCDSTVGKSCSLCQSLNIRCNYESRATIQNPTQRIRDLEQQLTQARALLAKQPPSAVQWNGQANEVGIKILERSGYLELPLKDPIEHAVRHLPGTSNAEKRQLFFGPSSGYSFLQRTLELFLKEKDSSTAIARIQPSLLTLFDRAKPAAAHVGSNSLAPHFPELPPTSLLVQMVKTTFIHCSLLAGLLNEADTHDLMAQSSELASSDAYTHQSLILSHAVLSIAWLYHVPLHRGRGCRAVHVEAQKHFLAAASALNLSMSQCDDLIALQSIACIVIFLISTSRLVLAHTYIGIACSATLRLGLHRQTAQSLSRGSETQDARLRILLTVLRLDGLVSVVLGLPAFIDHHSVDQSLIQQRATFMPGHLSHTNAYHEANEIESSAKHTEILGILASAVKALASQEPKSRGIVGSDHLVSSTATLQSEKVQAQLQGWFRDSAPFIQQHKSSTRNDLARYELEMTYYLSRIITTQPFLQYLTKSIEKAAISRNESQYALISIKIASITISRSEDAIKRGLLSAASWVPVYTIFLAVCNLVFLVAAHHGTSRPGEAWKKATRGVRLLAAVSCCDGAAAACLDILKNIISELSHTIDIDVDQVKYCTARLCQYSHLDDKSAKELDSIEMFEGFRSHSTTSHLDVSINSSVPITSLKPPSGLFDPIFQTYGDTRGEISEPQQCDADSILAHAQEISLGHPLEDLIVAHRQ